jgi:5-methyltetrahydropteroyltriglutamate--homocysteine methyltransferase
MVRWYNTNTFYQTPIVDGPISSGGTVLWRKVEHRFVRQGSFRLAVPDPLTFSELAEDEYYHDREKVMFAYSEALNEELRTLQSNGVGYVQFSSPALVARFRTKPLPRDGLRQLGEALRATVRGLTIPTGFHTFFGDASRYLPDLFDVLPTSDVGFDFTQTDPARLSATRKGVIAGIADARTTYLEGPRELRERTEQIVDATGARSVTLAPSCDLRYIPRASADEKLRRLGDLRAEMEAS